MTKPLIGVTVSEIRRREGAQLVPHGEPTHTEMTVGLYYMHAIERAGGLPVALPPLQLENVGGLLDQLSGLLLTGGPDLDPSCYGAKQHSELGPTDPAIDMFELALCRYADERGIPILGICRGAQVLNVARRGTLHQHVPDLTDGDVEHRQPEPGDRTTHEVRVAPDSGLAQTTGGGPVKVNSFHHQAIDRPGVDLRPVAWAEDGVIEAIEGDGLSLVLGVQWHAETLSGDAEQLALFERLVASARIAAHRDHRDPRDPGERGALTLVSSDAVTPPLELAGHGLWAQWPATVAPWTVGVEEEVMLLDPTDWSLASRADSVISRLTGELAAHTSTETHGSALELRTDPHATVSEGMGQLEYLRGELARELETEGLRAAVAGLHPFTLWQDTRISEGHRYRFLYGSMRELARREPTFALHIHVAVPDPESALRAFNRLRSHLPLLLALSANSPFWQGRETGLASARTPLFQAFPRVGIPRAFADYDDYVSTIDLLLRCEAFPEPTFLWWDVRLQPRFGTIEVRIMDAQTTIADSAALAALVQCLVRLEAGEGSGADPAIDLPEVLAENRFLAARDGIGARLIDARLGCRCPVANALESVLAMCIPHAEDLGCTEELDWSRNLVATPRPVRQLDLARGPNRLPGLVEALAALF